MHKKQLVVIGVLLGLLLVPLLGQAAWKVSDNSRSTVTPDEYNAIVRTLWDVFRDQTPSGDLLSTWGIGEKNPDVTLDVAGTVKVGDSQQTCTSDTRGVISYHIEGGDTENHFWGCNGSTWKQLDGIPQ